MPRSATPRDTEAPLTLLPLEEEFPEEELLPVLVEDPEPELLLVEDPLPDPDEDDPEPDEDEDEDDESRLASS